jgi:hypothetical protein
MVREVEFVIAYSPVGLLRISACSAYGSTEVFQADISPLEQGISLDTQVQSLGTNVFAKGYFGLIQTTHDWSHICARALAKAPGMKATGGRRASATKLVVVIDDDRLVLDAMGGLLRSWGFQVVAAETAAEAMVRLPAMDGGRT